ncbi:type II/IV secretion system protein, partial [Acinetobacter baumannii]
LIDIGIERYLLASTLAGVMAQRLVRKLCPHCARPAVRHGRRIGAWAIPDGVEIDFSGAREAVGCEACHGTGYLGRTGIAELLVIDDDMREAIGRRDEDQKALMSLARRTGFQPLYENG